MITTLIACALAGVIAFRAVCVAVKVSKQHFVGIHGRAKWQGFALSYVALGGAAGFSALQIAHHGGTLALWLFLLSSAGLILFDPRRPG